MKKMLVHICCAPCFVAPLFRLRESFELTGFWFNPNIHPVTEYYHRQKCLRDFISEENIMLIEKDDYGLYDFLKQTLSIKTNRCSVCYYMRFDMTAKHAKIGNFDYFSTSLLYSKRQNHELIKEICNSVAQKHDIEFFYQDFREDWHVGIELSKEKNMYRQKYCGCIFSEMERYWKGDVL